jgi:hypothetical protein
MPSRSERETATGSDAAGTALRVAPGSTTSWAISRTPTSVWCSGRPRRPVGHYTDEVQVLPKERGAARGSLYETLWPFVSSACMQRSWRGSLDRGAEAGLLAKRAVRTRYGLQGHALRSAMTVIT